MGHESSCAALGVRALLPKPLHLSRVIDLVELEDGELDLLVLVLDLLRFGVGLLLTLLGASPETEHKVERGFLLDIVVGKGSAVLKLLSGEDQTLLVGGDSFLVLDLGLYVVNGVGGLHLEGDCLPGKGFDVDLLVNIIN